MTILLEWHAVYWTGRWAYSDLMPIVPFLGIGVVPILQWLVLPPAVLYFLRRHYLDCVRVLLTKLCSNDR